MTKIYTCEVTVTGGRQGVISSDDGVLDLRLSTPKSLGGAGGATNPEQLFAAGYAACFGNAVIHLTRGMGFRIRDQDVRVTAKVDLNQIDPRNLNLAVKLSVAIAGVSQAEAEEIATIAHDGCPYSKAIRGNVDVQVDVKAGL